PGPLHPPLVVLLRLGVVGVDRRGLAFEQQQVLRHVTVYNGYVDEPATPQGGLPYGVLQSSPTGPRYSFDAGALCLQFAVTGGEDERARWETLHAPADLQRWLAICPLALEDVEVTPDDVVEARRLREAVWQVALRLAHREPARPGDLAVLN